MRLLSAFVLVVSSAACTSTVEDDFPLLEGRYLGQPLPGNDVQLFAPGIVSTGLHESAIAVSPDGLEIFYVAFVRGLEVLITTRLEDGRWTRPEVAPFASRFNDGWPSFHPDGSKLYFHSFRALDGSDAKDSVVSIWYAEKVGAGWGEARPVPGDVNGNGFVCCASVSEGGTMYYSKKIENGEIVYRSRFAGGRYVDPEPLPETVNAGRFQFHAAISPDESYLVLPLGGRDDAINKSYNYYVFFRDEADTWTGPINLGEAINDGNNGGTPSISADGEFLFFEANSGRDYVEELERVMTYVELQRLAVTRPSHLTGDIFWISTDYIESLRPGSL